MDRSETLLPMARATTANTSTKRRSTYLHNIKARPIKNNERDEMEGLKRKTRGTPRDLFTPRVRGVTTHQPKVITFSYPI